VLFAIEQQLKIAIESISKMALRTVTESVRIIIEFATLANNVSSGGFFNKEGAISW
jgi:hypothetical protein